MESRSSPRASPRLTRPLMSKIVASAVSRILIFRLIERIPFPRTLFLSFWVRHSDPTLDRGRSGLSAAPKWVLDRFWGKLAGNVCQGLLRAYARGADVPGITTVQPWSHQKKGRFRLISLQP